MKLTSQALPSSDAYKANEMAHLKALSEVREAAEAAALGGGEKSRARHESRGKMLPRERVANLLDPGSPFLEIGATAAHGLYDGAAPCAGVIAGIGRVRRRGWWWKQFNTAPILHSGYNPRDCCARDIQLRSKGTDQCFDQPGWDQHCDRSGRRGCEYRPSRVRYNILRCQKRRVFKRAPTRWFKQSELSTSGKSQ